MAEEAACNAPKLSLIPKPHKTNPDVTKRPRKLLATKVPKKAAPKKLCHDLEMQAMCEIHRYQKNVALLIHYYHFNALFVKYLKILELDSDFRVLLF